MVVLSTCNDDDEVASSSSGPFSSSSSSFSSQTLNMNKTLNIRIEKKKRGTFCLLLRRNPLYFPIKILLSLQRKED